VAEVKKQGIKNFLINNLGFAIGGVNYIFLLPVFFATYEIGLIKLLISLANVWVSLAKVGTNITFVRFFKEYETEDREHKGFVHWIYLLAAGGMIALSLIYLAFRPWIEVYYIDKSSLFVESFFLTLIPFAFLMLLFSVLESQASAIHRTVLSNFLREVLLRLIFMIGIVAFSLKWFELEGFVWLHIASYGLICAVMIFDLSRTEKFKWKSGIKLSLLERKSLTSFSLLMMLTAGSQQLILNLDSIMLGGMMGLDDVGVYGVYLSLAILVALPERSLMRILYPVANEALIRKDWDTVRSLYRKSAELQLIGGLWILIGIWANEHNFFAFLKEPAYQTGFPIFIILGMHYLINGAFGINSYLILGTQYYKIETYLNLLLLVFTVIFNYFFIQAYGTFGAAAATLLSVTLINVMRWAFILHKFKLSPFSWKQPVIVVWGTLCLLAVNQIPKELHTFIDLPIRSGLLTGLYFGGLVLFKVSEDVNQTFLAIWQRIFNKKAR